MPIFSDLSELLSQLQAQHEVILSYAKFIGVLLFGILLLCSLFRFIFGKESQLNHAVSSAIEILCLYIVCIVIYSLGLHWKLFLSPLPFVSIEGDYLQIMPILSADFHLVCEQVLKVVIIAFLVNILEDIMPKGEKVLTWFFFRMVTVALAVGANYLADRLIGLFLPPEVFAMAETVLLLVLVALVLLGSLKFITGIALAFLDPIIGALYTFFFSNIVGRELAKALVSTAIVTALVALLDHLGLTTVFIAAAGLAAYIPILLALLLVWFLLSKIL